MNRRKPTRKDLLVVIGELQNRIGLAKALCNDRNPDRQAQVDHALQTAIELCVEARSYDPPLDHHQECPSCATLRTELAGAQETLQEQREIVSRFTDCHGGPGTTLPGCGVCLTCVLRENEALKQALAAARAAMGGKE